MPADEHDPIDRLLRIDASAWQSKRPPSRDVRPEWFTDSPSIVGRLVSVVAVAGLVAALGFLLLRSVMPSQPPVGTTGPQHTSAVGVATQRPDATASPGPIPSESPRPTRTATLNPPSVRPSFEPAQSIVEIGDRVVGTGVIIAPQAREPYFCTEPISIGTAAGCGGEMTSIPISGIDPRSIDGTERAGAWVTEYVTAHGIWLGTSMQIVQAIPTEPPIEIGELPPAPCPAPLGGWPGVTGDAAAELADLESQVVESPDHYSGIWYATARSGSIEPQDVVVVVGTVGDVDQAFDELRAIYASNLCLVAVPYSASELTDIAAALSALDLPWHVQVPPESNAVVVRAFVLDRQISDAVTPYGRRVVVQPSVDRED